MSSPSGYDQSNRYICLDCGQLFDDPHKYVERHGFTSGPYEEWEGCPSCGGAFDEAKWCPHCDHIVANEDMQRIEHSDGTVERVCEACYTRYEDSKALEESLDAAGEESTHE